MKKLLSVVILSATALSACNDDSSDTIEIPTVTMPNTTVGAYNYSATPYHLSVATWDWVKVAFTEHPLGVVPAADGTGPGVMAGLVDLPPTSPTMEHAFWVRDLSGTLLASSSEFVKGTAPMTIYARVLTGPIVQHGPSATGPWE